MLQLWTRFLEFVPQRFRFVAALAVFAALGFVTLFAIQAIFFPWSASVTGPTLTGEWFGKVTSPTGKRQMLWLHIRPPYRPCFGCSELSGEAATCDANGAKRRLLLGGDVDNEDPSRVSIKVSGDDDDKVDLRLGQLNGVWEGAQLRLKTRLIAPNASVTASSTKNADGSEVSSTTGAHPDTVADVEIVLTPASETTFAAACKALAR